MTKCKYCKDFKAEKEEMIIEEITVGGMYYGYICPLIYCPNCGKRVRKVEYLDEEYVRGLKSMGVKVD